VLSDEGADGCRSCLGREIQSTGAWWVKDLSVTLRLERTEGRCRVIISEERVRLNMENAVEIRRYM